MKLEKLSSQILSGVRQVTNTDIQSIRVEYCHEEYVGHYGIYYVDMLGESRSVNPGDYQLTYEESEILNDYLLSQKLKGIKTNKLSFIINSDLTYTIDTSWDQHNHEINESLKKEALKEIALKPEISDLQIHPGRFVPSDKFAAKQSVLSFDVSEPKITAQLFVRIYSLLGIEPDVNYEGFLYSILDSETGLHFGAGRSASGIGYFANDNDQSSIDSIQEFHSYLFSDHFDLEECSLSFEHDFGQTNIGYLEGKIFEIEVTE